MNYIRLTITEPFNLSIKFPLMAAEIGAMVLGASLVFAPVAAVAKVVTTNYTGVKIALPLPAVESKPVKEVSQREVECLANNIYYEARNQSSIGQLAVGLVTLTRVEQAGWSDGVCGVVHKPKQFSWVHDGKQRKVGKRVAADEAQYLNALNLASRILYGDFDNVRDVFEADHYHTTKVHPKWAKKMDKLETIGSHVFYVDR